MRIAIFSDNFYPELSGISDSIISLAEELNKMGHGVAFFVPEYSQKNYERVGLTPKNPVIGDKTTITRFCSFPAKTGTGQGRLVVPTGLRWLKVKQFKPDVIHTQLFFGVGIEALIAAKKLDIPIVGTNHTAIREFAHYLPVKSDWLASLMIRYVNWYYGKCGLVTAPSKSVIKEMEEFGFKGKSVVVSNPIDTKTFSILKNRAEIKKEFGFSKKTMIYAGRLAKEKNIDVIIRAMPKIISEVPEAEFVIAGNGAEEDNLKNLARNLGIERNVKFLGFLDHQKLARAYNASELFAITSTSETQGMVMMQAMACGLPVIGVRSRGLPEYINSKNGLLVEPNDENALAKKAIFILKENDKRKKYGAEALKFAKNFSPPKIAAQWMRIYQTAIDGYNNKK